MNLSNLIIVPKVSTYELDLRRYALTPEGLIAKYRMDGLDTEKIIQSHERQQKSLAEIRRFFRR